MEKTHLSYRLQTVANFVPKGAKLLDVGSDHAYLPIALLEQGTITSAIAGEVVDGPYQSALKNVIASNLTEKIQVRLANGLEALEDSDKIDTITIAGMGGRLIADILENGKDKLDRIKHLILQPNNQEDCVRKWLMINGFKIIAEELLSENNKFYEIIVASPGQDSLTPEQIRFGPKLLQSKPEAFIERWGYEQKKLELALEKIPLEKKEERKIVSSKISKIKEIIVC